MSHEPVRHRLGEALWFVRPLYLVVELAVASAVTVRYSLLDNTISDLGARTCTDVWSSSTGAGIANCSPWHPLMNATFVVTGVFLALGAVLLADRLGGGLVGGAVVVLLVISGLSSIGTGLVPLDQDRDLHFLVSAPVFVAQPLALVLLGAAMWSSRRRVAGPALVATGVVSIAGAVGFLLVDVDDGGGLLERVAIWPALVALAWVATDLRRRPVAQSAGRGS